MIRKYQYSPILGWSISRSDLFYQCKRGYFYHYYYKDVRTCPVEKVKYLKFLTSVPLEVGQVVHDGIAYVISGPLKHGHAEDIEPEAVTKRYVNLMKESLKSKNFVEDYYPQYPRDKDADIENGLEKIRTSILQFFNSKWYSWLKECPDEFKERWIIEPKDYGECPIGGLKAYCKVDFAFPDEKGGYYILDWKTGKIHEAKHKTQMLGYIFYAIDQFPVSAERVTPLVIYLGSEYKELAITGERDLEGFKAKVKHETEDMYRYCANINENVPMDEDNFEGILNSGFCAYCKFQEICNETRQFES